MSLINKLTENIKFLESQIMALENELRQNGDNFRVQLDLKNYKAHLNDLRHQLYIENNKRSKEILSLRLIGSDAKYGSIPLGMVSGILDTIAKAIFETSKFIQYGKRGGKKVNKIISDTLDLRLDAIGAGSTIFYISAKTNPDLFGNSLTQSTFDNIIDFVSSESNDDLIEKIDNIGTSSIKYFSAFFQNLNKDNLEVGITVNSPFRGTLTWNADANKIINLYTVLNSLVINDPIEVEFDGEIISLSKRGKIEILDNTGFRYLVDYPDNMLEIIRELHISQSCYGKLLKTTIINPSTGKEKSEYDLIQISPH